MMWSGHVLEAVRVFDRVAEIGADEDAWDIEVLGEQPYVEALSIRAIAHSLTGRLSEGLEFVERLSVRIRRAAPSADIASAASDRVWLCWVAGDAERAQRCAGEALQLAERFGSEKKIVYALLACGVASCLGQRWEAGCEILQRANPIIAETGAGAEWQGSIDCIQSLCLASLGDDERAVALARRSAGAPSAGLRMMIGSIQARALRVAGGLQCEAELDAHISTTLALMQEAESMGWLHLLLLERAGLARLRGDSGGMARDLAEARRLFKEIGVTGWDAYARSIEA